MLELSTALFSSGTWCEVESNDRCQSGDADKRDVASRDRSCDVSLGGDINKSPDELVSCFGLGGSEGDEVDCWPERAKYRDDEKVAHPDNSKETASSASKHRSFFIGFTEEVFL